MTSYHNFVNETRHVREIARVFNGRRLGRLVVSSNSKFSHSYDSSAAQNAVGIAAAFENNERITYASENR